MVQRRNSRSYSFLALLAAIFAILLIFTAVVFLVPAIVADKVGHKSADLSIPTKLSVSFELLKNSDTLHQPYLTNQENVLFEIQSGESVEMICLRLEAEGLISDAHLLRAYLIFTGMDRQLQSGTFLLNPAMPPIEIVKSIINLDTSTVQFVILPGWRLEEIAATIPSSGLSITPDDFLAFVYSPPANLLEQLSLPPGSSLEGYLFPDSYQLSRDTNLPTLINTLIARTLSNFTTDFDQAIAAQGLTRHQGIILASIIQREGMVPDERRMIASVFMNRLNAGMRLETDPTIQYALGFQSDTSSWWKSPLYYDDLTVTSLYNTYLYLGLPPGPISNPDLTSIYAVAYPAQTSYYYFRAKCDGSQLHNFAVTFDEHLSNECP